MKITPAQNHPRRIWALAFLITSAAVAAAVVGQVTQPASSALVANATTTPPQQQPTGGATGAAGAPATAGPNLETWMDDFDGDALDPAKWEQYSIEGGGGKPEVKGGRLRQRGADGSRAGVRSVKTWRGDRFFVEASIAKVGELLGAGSNPRGFANLTILLNSRGTDRIEWIFTSDNQFEAWATTTPNGRLERLDSRNLATREEAPRLGIGRRGDQVFFMLNGQVGLQKTIKSLPDNFRVMLYGFGSSENIWDSVVVQTPKQ